MIASVARLSRVGLALVVALASACGPPAAEATADEHSGGEREARPDAGVVEGTPDPDAPAGREPSASETAALEPLLRAAESVRGLRFVRDVPVRIQTRTEITAFVHDAIEADELERARIFYVALGLLDPDLDIEALLLRVMGEQIVGYYDPDHGRMVIRDDVMVELGERGMGGAEAAVTLVHEYVHALQDQVLGLGEHDDDERSIDGENAFAALIEGDATLAMIGMLALGAHRDLDVLTADPDLLRSIISPDAVASGGAELAAAPTIVRVPLISRYLDGMLFCAYLHGSLGGWSAVDDAHRSLPVSTEEILHPHAHGTEPPDVIVLPPLPALDGAGWAMHDEDTLGELETSIYMAVGTDEDRDASGAEGWGGDRIRVYTRGAETAVVWATSWDDEREAIEAEAAFDRVRDAVPSATRAGHRVTRSGRVVVVMRDVPAAMQAEIEAAVVASTLAGLRSAD